MDNSPSHPPSSKTPFRFMHLLIALVLLGGITVFFTLGKDIKHTSDTHAIIYDLNSYFEALILFEEKYNALPGDYPFAITTWPNAANKNGNNNGLIEYGDSLEYVHAWQQLSLSGFVRKSYIADFRGDHPQIGINIPEASMGNAGWQLESENFYERGNVNYLMLATQEGDFLDGGAITVKQAIEIENKMFDDGTTASNGHIIFINDFSDKHAKCVDIAPDATPPAKFNINDPTARCVLIFYY